MKQVIVVATIASTISGFFLPVATYFRKRDYRVDAMARGASSCPTCLSYFDHVWDVYWSRNPFSIYSHIRSIRHVRRIVKNERYDIVHVHTPIAAFLTRFALRHMRRSGQVKVIYTAHGFHFYEGGSGLKNLLFLSLEKLAGRWTDFLVVINREDEEAALRYGIVAADRVVYLPGIGIDLQFFSRRTIASNETGRLRAELGVSRQAPLFLMAAELVPGKRPLDVLKAFAELPRRDAHLLIAGEGPLMKRMQRLCASLNLDRRVHFLGYRDDIPALLCASVATLLASEREGLPRCILESMSMGVPVIATNIRGVRDLLAGGGGLMVGVGEIDGFVRAMMWVLEHPEDARAMGVKGQRAVEPYDINRILQLHEELYSTRVLRKNPNHEKSEQRTVLQSVVS